MAEELPAPPSPHDPKQFDGVDLPKEPMPMWEKRVIVYGGTLVAIGLLCCVCGLFTSRSTSGSPVSRAKSDLRSLATALETYYVDHGAYPAYTTDVTLSEAAPYYKGKPNKKQPWNTPTFRRASEHLAGLTTPVAYISSMFPDPYMNVKGRPFAYYSRKSGEYPGIVYCAGPDGDIDISETDYDPAIPQPSPQLLNKSYDPTNGTRSSGDLWRVSQ